MPISYMLNKYDGARLYHETLTSMQVFMALYLPNIKRIFYNSLCNRKTVMCLSIQVENLALRRVDLLLLMFPN